MKPRHVRRALVGLALVGAALLVASLVIGFLDDSLLQQGTRDDDEDAVVDSRSLGPDDPGGFHRFQDELVRRKEEEAQRERLASDDDSDVIDVSEAEVAEFVVSIA